MKAIIADIHGNLEALLAVLADIAALHVREIYCLGDLVGWGPNPRECVDLLLDCPVVLQGNYDVRALVSPSPSAPEWEHDDVSTRRQLALPVPDAIAARSRRQFLAGLPMIHREAEFLFVHGSPLDPLNGYLFPDDICNPGKMNDVFAMVDQYGFMGHTHLPGIITDELQYFSPETIGDEWTLDEHKILCNVGSVGASLGSDWRASYVVLDGNTIHFRRVGYDVETTERKARDMRGD